MITVHDGFAEDFAGLGLGALTPISCTVQEEAEGRYEAELVQPITAEGRHRWLQMDNILRIPAPVSEAAGTVIETDAVVRTQEIWRVQASTRLRLRKGPGTSTKVLGSYPSGTEVVRLGEEGQWMQVALLKGGAKGWMHKSYLRYVRTDTVQAGGTAVVPVTARDQLFRIYNLKSDSEKRMRTALAQHISYDLRGVIVVGEYSPSGVAAREVCAQIMARADHDAGFALHCGIDAPVSGEYGGRNIIDCLLDETDGIIRQADAVLVRDNYDLYILPRAEAAPKLELRRGRNLLAAELTEDAGERVTRIRPVGRKKNGDPLYGDYVDSAHIAEIPAIYTREIEYDVSVGKDGISTEAQAKAKLAELAREDFEKNGIDAATMRATAEFLRLEQTAKYAILREQYALYMHDAVRVLDEEADIAVVLQMSAYIWDALNERYEDTDLGDLLRLDSGGSSYGGGGAGGTRVIIQPGQIGADAVSTRMIRDGAVTLAKLDWPEIEAAIRAIIDEMI